MSEEVLMVALEQLYPLLDLDRIDCLPADYRKQRRLEALLPR